MANLLLNKLVRTVLNNPTGAEIYVNDSQAKEVFQALEDGCLRLVRRGTGSFRFETDHESEAFLIRSFGTGTRLTYQQTGYQNFFVLYWNLRDRYLGIEWDVRQTPVVVDPFAFDLIDSEGAPPPIVIPPPGIGPGAAITPKVEYRNLTPTEATTKQLTLTSIPEDILDVEVDVIGGGPQHFGVDYSVTGGLLTWNGFGLEPFLVSGDVLRISYFI